MSITSNDPAQEPETAENLEKRLKDAQSAFRSAKKASVYALAHLHIIYLKTWAPYSERENREWIRKQIEEHNRKVAKLSSEEDEAHPLLALTTDGDDLLPLVKLVSGLVRKGEEAAAARLKRALEWTIEKLQKREIREPEDVVQAVDEAGGYEVIIQEARTGSPQSHPKIEAAVASRIAKLVASSAKSASAKYELDQPAELDLGDNFALLLARAGRDGKIDIIGQRLFNPEIKWDLLKPYSESLITRPSLGGELLRRITILSNVVPEGGLTMMYEGEGFSTAPVRVKRAISLNPADDGKFDIEVSARHVEATPMVRLTPKDCLGLDGPLSALTMELESVDAVAKLYATAGIEHCIALTSRCGRPGADYVWTLSSDIELGKDKKSLDLAWVELTTSSPVTVHELQKSATAHLTAQDVRTGLFDVIRSVTRKAHSGNEKQPGPSHVRLIVRNDELSFAGDATMRVGVKMSSGGTKPFSLMVPTVDLANAADVIQRLQLEQVTVFADEAGLLVFNWSDDVAVHEIYLPTLTSTGGLKSARFGSLMPTDG